MRVLLFEDATGSWGFCMFLERQRLLAHTLTSPMLRCTSPQLAELHGLEMPCFELYRLHKESWRRAVATWHKLKEQDSKKELLIGCTYARRVDGELLPCPLLEGLAVESQRRQARLCEQSPDLLKCVQESGKPRPETSVLAYLLFEQGREVPKERTRHSWPLCQCSLCLGQRNSW